MGEVPTKPGRGAPQVRNAIEDTLRVEPPLDAAGAGTAATRSIPAEERYRLGAELGRGGMGRVVEAYDLQLGRTVALKEVLPKAGANVARRFAREVQLTARLEHPSIVPLYDSGTTADGRPFYVMRRVTGRPFDQLMAQAVGLGERLTLLPALLAAIDAVAHAHRRGVIHRDLKPANILVGELGETVVIDWGLAKVIGEDDDRPGTVIVASDSLRTQMGSVFGTPGFMAPEQARGEEIDPRGDVYALGATLYQLLAGAPPHAGTSATDVIAKTSTREVVPVDVIAPGAPPELVAIVGKALAFDQAGRYADAGALGEDVRRFLAGQLVAAHRYTRRQRLWRFTRRHRAPLAVAALATVAVAMLAWIGVRRIIAERDAANYARAVAAWNQRSAEQARDELQRRADQLLVTQARGLVDANPTRAAAILKQLPETSARIGDARAVAQAAIVRGAAWAIEGSHEYTAYAELSADARSLFQISRDGLLQVWDLDRRRLVITRRYPVDTRATWAGTALLVTGKTAPELIDPFSSSSAGTSASSIDKLSVGPISWAVATARGDRVAFLDDNRAAHLLDVATRTAHPLWPGHQPSDLAIADDGSWIALADKTTLTVLDPTGRELATHPGHAQRLAARSDQIAFLSQDRAVICTVSPRPTWTEVDLAPLLPARPVDVVFRGTELDIYMTSGSIVAWNGTRLWERLKLGGLTFGLRVANRDLLVAPGIDGKLHVSNDLLTAALHLPTPLKHLKVYARPGAQRIIALGDGVIVGFDLADSLPEHLQQPPGTSTTFVDDNTLLLWRNDGGTWHWYDVRSRATTSFAYRRLGLPRVIDADPTDGRVLLQELTSDTQLVLLRKNTDEQRTLLRGSAAWGRLLPGGAVLAGSGDGRLLAITAAGPPREVAKLAGIAESAVSLGGTAFAAISSAGELVRGDLATNNLVRTRIPTPTSAVIAGDRTGRVIIGADDRLLLWDRDVIELARLDKPIVRIEPTNDGALLELADHAIVHTTLTPTPPTLLVGPSSRPPLISADGHLIAAESVNGQTVIVEVPTRATWELPAYFASLELATISPTTRRFIQTGFGTLALWTLPLAPPELSAWLDERTNAITNGDHPLVWSWQLAHR